MGILRPAAPFAGASGKFDAPALPGSESAIVAMPDANGRTISRNYKTPANPRTTAQDELRDAMSLVAAALPSISSSDRTTWETLATELHRTGRLELDYTANWSAVFQRVNIMRILDGAGFAVTAPAPTPANAPSSITDFTAQFVNRELFMNEDFEPTPGSFLAIRTTGNLNSSARRARPNEFRFPNLPSIMIMPADVSNPWFREFASPRVVNTIGNWAGVQISVLNAGYLEVARITRRNVIVGTL